MNEIKVPIVNWGAILIGPEWEESNETGPSAYISVSGIGMYLITRES